MTSIYYENQELSISDFVEDTWESFLESSEDEWGTIVVETLDEETLKLLDTF
jgi:hypothetical protein